MFSTRPRLLALSLCLGLPWLSAQEPYWRIDPTFISARTAQWVVRQPDGKYLIRGQPANSLARLNANGALDSTFSSGIGVAEFALLSSGKILATGDFSSNASSPAFHLARFNSNGTRDVTYLAPTDFRSLASDAEGYSYGYLESGTQELTRLTPDGASDPSFVCAETAPEMIAPLTDGAILVKVRDGRGGYRLLRIRHDGSLDSSFIFDDAADPQSSRSLDALVPLPDGRAVVGVTIYPPIVGTLGYLRLSRILPTGAVDYVYTSEFATNLGPTNRRFTLADVMLNLLRESGGASLPVNFSGTSERSNFLVTSDGQLLMNEDGAGFGGVLVRYTSNNSPGLDSLPFVLTDITPQQRTVNEGETVEYAVLVGGLAPFTYQWKRNGVDVPGAIGPSLHLAEVQPSDAGDYIVTVRNAYGSTSSNPVHLTVLDSSVAPKITAQPQSQTGDFGGNVTFAVSVIGPDPLTYQWYHEGIPIPGAKASMLALTNLQGSDSGAYTVKISSLASSQTSAVATLTLLGASRISNLSVRTSLGAGKTLVVGFVTNSAKNLLVRAVGPSLKTVFGADGFFPDPHFNLIGQNSSVIAQNDNWSSTLSATFASLGAFPLNALSNDAALVTTISGPATAEISGVGSGLLLVELYDAGSAASPARLKNVSARNFVGTGSDNLVSGFVIDGTGTMKLLIRGIGPALTDVFGVGGVLADPILEVHQTINGRDTILASNDNWNAGLSPTFAAVGAYAFKAGSKDAALLVTLPPGAYTAQVSGANAGTGDGVVEVYEVP